MAIHHKLFSYVDTTRTLILLVLPFLKYNRADSKFFESALIVRIIN